MTQGDRVKAVRKSKEVNLTLEKFGERVGVGKTAISKIEKGENNLSDQMKKSICREFGVDYIWLTTGEGEMFIDSDDDIMERIDRIMMGENEFHKKLFKSFARLDEAELLVLEKLLDQIIEMKKEKD